MVFVQRPREPRRHLYGAYEPDVISHAWCLLYDILTCNHDVLAVLGTRMLFTLLYVWLDCITRRTDQTLVHDLRLSMACVFQGRQIPGLYDLHGI